MKSVAKILGGFVSPLVLCAAVLSVALPGSAQTRSAASVARGGERLLRANTVTEIAANSVLQLDGTMRVAGNSKVTLKLNNQSLVKGSGVLKVEKGSTLTLESTQGALGTVAVDNRGTVILKGLLDCQEGLVFHSYGTLVVSTTKVNATGDMKRVTASVAATYPEEGAKFYVHDGGVITGNGVLNGDLIVEAGGKVVLTPASPSQTASYTAASVGGKDSSGQTPARTAATPTASPDYLIVTGEYSGYSCAIEVQMNISYYGQMAVAQTISLTDAYMNVTLNGYTPAYADAFRVLRAPNIVGSVASFNATALNFDNRGIITVSGTEKAYRLSGY